MDVLDHDSHLISVTKDILRPVVTNGLYIRTVYLAYSAKASLKETTNCVVWLLRLCLEP